MDAASYASAHLHYSLVESQAFFDGDIVGAFKEAFSKTDLHYLERSAREGKKSGSTALCALLENRSKIYLAWLGDSMAILVRNGKPIDIMIPHKPELEEERKRIEEMGGFVAYVDTWRVNGTLAVSRAIGDPEYKPYISSEPDVVQLDIDSETDFLIMACDGLWDQLTPEEATSLVYEYICENSEQNIEEISTNVATHLSKTAKFDGSSDNITTIVIFFKDLEELRATPFTPLTPREKNESNGLNGNHFQYNDFEFTQSNGKNPFDLSSNSTTDQMNVAKLNFEISDNSMNSSENSTNDSKGISNPFSSNDYSYADLNKPFNTSTDNNLFNNESSLLKEPTNSFDIYDKLESDISHTIGNDGSSLQYFQSDSQFNISKLSEISSSLPTQAVIHSDHALCSTPLHTDTDITEFPPEVKSNVNQNTGVLETNMDFTDAINDSIIEQSIESDLNGRQFQSFGSAQSDFNDSNSFDRTAYQTAYETDFEQHLEDTDANDTPLKSPINLEEVCQQVFSDIDDQNQESHDLSSGAESVDSFCYEKIGSDLSKISEKVSNDYQLQQIYGTVPTESHHQIESQESDDKTKNDTQVENTEAKQSNSGLISEVLMGEHMTPDEAQEVAKQLFPPQTETEPFEAFLADDSTHQISFDEIKNETNIQNNLFESNETKIEETNEEISSSAQNSIIFNEFEDSNVHLKSQQMTNELICEDHQNLFEERVLPQTIGESDSLKIAEELVSENREGIESDTTLIGDIPALNTQHLSEDKSEESAELLTEEKECKDQMIESIISSAKVVEKPISEPNIQTFVDHFTEELISESNSDLMSDSQINSNLEEPLLNTAPDLCAAVTPHISQSMNIASDENQELNSEQVQYLIQDTTSQLEPNLESTSEQIPEPSGKSADPILRALEELKSETIPEPMLEPTAESIPEPMSEQISEPMAKPTSEPTAELTSEPMTESIPGPMSEPISELKAEPIPEPTAEPICELMAEPTSQSTAEPVSKQMAEPTPEMASNMTVEGVTQMISNTISEPSQESKPIEKELAFNGIISEDKLIGDSSSATLESKSKESQIDTKVISIEKQIKTKETSKTQPFNSKAVPSKTTKPQTKYDPKSKPIISSSTANKSGPNSLSKVGTTSKTTSGPNSSKASSVANIKTITKTLNNSVEPMSRTVARKITATATTRSATSLGPKGGGATKPVTSTIKASTNRAVPTASSKTPVKAVPARAPIAARTTTTRTNTTSAPAARPAPIRSTAQPTNISTRVATKPVTASNLIRKTTTAPKTSSNTINGTKTVGISAKTTTTALKTTTSRVNTVRSATSSASASTKPTSKTNTTFSVANKTGGLPNKPISIKGKTGKDMATPIPPIIDSNGVSKMATPSSSGKSNHLKVTNSLKQELEDALSQPNDESNPNFMSPEFSKNMEN